MAAARSAPKEDGIPSELKEKLATFDTHLSELEVIFSPILSVNRNTLTETLEPLDAAKTDLVAAYAINSLFWMYMNVCGINPKEHAVRQELGRIQSYMQRVKEIEDKKKAPKLDKASTKRFVKSALWQAAKKRRDDVPLESEPSTSTERRREKQGGKKHKKNNY
ncbi:DNA-binding protein c1d [Biomphalaria glabrata]|nr:nuclear nucleic acid-binding protein C1D-like; partial [Biomphalaria glabrata]